MKIALTEVYESLLVWKGETNKKERKKDFTLLAQYCNGKKLFKKFGTK